MNEQKYNQRLSTLELVCISNAIWTALSLQELDLLGITCVQDLHRNSL